MKNIWSGQNWNRENKKRFYEDRSFKKRDIVSCSSRIEETEGRKTYFILFLKKKTKGTKYGRYERHIIVWKV